MSALHDRARKHLHELWLRELQCFAIVDGNDTRLDDSYQPESSPPAWCKDLVGPS